MRVDGRLFSTLSTTTRKIQNRTPPILLTDTVGFIEDLPAWIIDAFHSTLEEIEVADVVLLVVDANEPPESVEKKLQISLKELRELGVTASVIIVLNKIDLLEEKNRENVKNYLKQTGVIDKKICIPISVKDKIGIDLLQESIYQTLPRLVAMKLTIPNTKQSQAFISELYEKTRVNNITYDENITIHLECNEKIRGKILSKCKAVQESFPS